MICIVLWENDHDTGLSEHHQWESSRQHCFHSCHNVSYNKLSSVFFFTVQYWYQMYSLLRHSMHVRKRRSCMRRWRKTCHVFAFMHWKQTGWSSQCFINSLVFLTNYNSSHRALTSHSLTGCQFLIGNCDIEGWMVRTFNLISQHCSVSTVRAFWLLFI